MSRDLTPKQLAFVEAYAGDVKAAAEAAGIAYGYARNLMTRSDIARAVRQRESERIRPLIMSREDRQKFWSEVAADSSQAMRDRLRASELLGKSEADFTERIEHTGEIEYVMRFEDGDSDEG